MIHRKKLQPRLPTPASGSSGGRLISSGRLPEDVLSEQVGRVAVFAAVGGGLWAFGLFMDQVVIPLAFGVEHDRKAMIIDSIGIAVSILAFLYFKYGRQTASKKIDVGLAYMIYRKKDAAKDDG